MFRVGGMLGDEAHEYEADSLEEPTRRVFTDGDAWARFGGGTLVLWESVR